MTKRGKKGRDRMGAASNHVRSTIWTGQANIIQIGIQNE